jgi:oligopeptide/dipeptide ABC transporter ATP-binding protein
MALLEVRDLVQHFPVRGGVLNRVVAKVHAVNGVSFDLDRRETLGVVGESGCGKSTLGKCVVRLYEPTAGSIRYEGREIGRLDHSALMPYRRRMQMIFQDPYSSLNPRQTVKAMLKEVIRFHRVVPSGELDAYVAELVSKVGLRPEAADKFPHEFSGGQRQRIGIARALALRPELLIADEPVSALDVSIQAQVLNLLMDLRDDLGLTLMFISHDLKVVEHFCDRVMVMYLGHVVEKLPCEALHERAQHPYTRALLAANPINDPDERRPLRVLEGDVPSPYAPPKGCPFAGRCPLVMDVCREEMPPLEEKRSGDPVACFAVE